ncbi:MAG: excisionase family DNA-binding protein [Microthrixaceae bacterium]|nr:excisionase family DNA-binding protein [Microthrixaceae bacterium]
MAQWTHLGRSTIYRLIEDNDLPAVRIGRSVRVRVCDYEAWVSDHLAVES